MINIICMLNTSLKTNNIEILRFVLDLYNDDPKKTREILELPIRGSSDVSILFASAGECLPKFVLEVLRRGACLININQSCDVNEKYMGHRSHSNWTPLTRSILRIDSTSCSSSSSSYRELLSMKHLLVYGAKIGKEELYHDQVCGLNILSVIDTALKMQQNATFRSVFEIERTMPRLLVKSDKAFLIVLFMCCVRNIRSRCNPRLVYLRVLYYVTYRGIFLYKENFHHH